ncbi:protein-tyrosine phosphatase-like protein [Cercophora samala]|uniref:Protein-tyrosine phosphatase-like protein n=1 Tax=Cercophora samala TaxID=330535 RepID=A0AA39Z8D8_9PEZI|nr:protein-tyrosine phosphatase-like protein [Cercophora samala]
MLDSSSPSTTSFEVEDADNEFDGIINFRDVGKTVNDFLGKKVLKEGILFRSAKLDDASYRDRLRLTEVYGIKSVIDLRSKTEHLNAQEKHKFLQKSLPLKIPGISYTRIILPSRRFELFLLWQLSWFNIFKFLLLYPLSRPHAISLISHHALAPLGLPSLSLNTLFYSSPSISLCLSSLFPPSPSPSSISPPPPPTIIHCTQGKDRTGLLLILILLTLSIPVPAITHDYHLTNSSCPLIRQIRLSEVREVGLPDSFADTHQEMVTSVISWLEETHGGVDGYLDQIGFDEAKRQRLRAVLLWEGEQQPPQHQHQQRDVKKSETSIDISPPSSPSDSESSSVVVVAIDMSKSETSI